MSKKCFYGFELIFKLELLLTCVNRELDAKNCKWK